MLALYAADPGLIPVIPSLPGMTPELRASKIWVPLDLAPKANQSK